MLSKTGNDPSIFETLPELLSIQQVSRILGVHPNTLRKWVTLGVLKSIRLGIRGDRRFRKSEILDAFSQGNWTKEYEYPILKIVKKRRRKR